MHNEHHEDYNKGKQGAAVGIITNSLLFVLKMFCGIFGRSHVMVADALHTATDSLTSIGVFIGFKIAEKPADAEHPYGHGKAESIAAKLVSLVLIIAGLGIGFDSIKVMISARPLSPGEK